MQSVNLIKSYPRHGYHLVDPSPWPFTGSISALLSVVGAVMYFHGYKIGHYFLFLGFLLLISVFFFWWKDIVKEATYEGYHTSVVQKGLRFGVILFIISEVFFFVAFFWSFFHNSVSPNIEIGNIWPPKGILVFNPWKVPFLNTMILLLSACSITWTHHSLIFGNRLQVIYSFIITIFLAFLFTFFQIFEYSEAFFCFSDGIYGSIFYMATGFHGFHGINICFFFLIILYFNFNGYFLIL